MSDENNINQNYNQSGLINNPNEEENNNYDIIIENNLIQNNANDNFNELQNQLMDNNNSSILDKFSSQEIYEILNDFIPSLFYSIIIYSAFKENNNYCDPYMFLMLKTLLTIYIGYILFSLFRSSLIYYNKQEKYPFKFFAMLLSAIITTFYFSSVFVSYFIYSKTDSKCFIQDNFTTIVFYSLLFIGLVNIFQKIIDLILICSWFIVMVNSFFSNPSHFYAQYGIDPEIIKSLPTIKADKKHVSCCVICTEDIKEGDEIMVLKCPAKHFFHASCIKSWLLVKTTCPMCRDENVL
jgi:hypothetical protein